jgi:hypothetical protein
LAVLVILLALQIVLWFTCRTSWKVNLKDLTPMAVECIVLAVPLIVFSLLLNRPAAAPGQGGAVANAALAAAGHNGFWGDIITALGAGIYEELIFRLILICFLMLLFQDIIGLTHTASMVIAVIVSAAFFSAYHHFDIRHGRIELIAAFSLPPFLFRTIAGVYFAGLFAVRGFGITAGTHAFYDILAAVINVFFFAAQE